MKKILLIIVFIQCLLSKAQTQINYCSRLDVLTKSAVNHFNDLIKVNNKDLQDSTRYMTNITFISDDVGSIFSSAGKEAIYVCAVIKNVPEEVEKFDDNIWACLLLRLDEKWQRREENNNVYYEDRATGVQITLFNNQGWLFIQIQFNPLLLVPVFSDHLCNEIDTLINAFTNNFSSLKGELIETKDGKKLYRSKIHLNHKSNYSDITETSNSLPGTMLYEYTVFISGSDLSVDTVIKRFDKCLLTENKGWIKPPKKATVPALSGIETYQKNKLTISILHSKSKADEAEDIVISIKKSA